MPYANKNGAAEKWVTVEPYHEQTWLCRMRTKMVQLKNELQLNHIMSKPDCAVCEQKWCSGRMSYSWTISWANLIVPYANKNGAAEEWVTVEPYHEQTWLCRMRTKMVQLKNELQLNHIMSKPDYAVCEQKWCRSACTSTQSNQHLCCSLPR